MLNHLDGYARRKGLTINNAKSEVVHFNSHGCIVPTFSVGGAPLANKDSFKYLGMVFCRTHNIAKSAEHMLGPFMAGCHRIRQFAREHYLNDRPHALLWLAKCYAIPTSMYACQIWGTWFMKQASEFDSPLQTAHLCFFKGVLGVKRSVPSWAVLRECGQEPLQFYWFRAAAKFFNSMLSGNSSLLKKIVHADHPQYDIALGATYIYKERASPYRQNTCQNIARSFQNPPDPTNDLHPRLMVEVCLVLAPDVNFFLNSRKQGLPC